MPQKRMKTGMLTLFMLNQGVTVMRSHNVKARSAVGAWFYCLLVLGFRPRKIRACYTSKPQHFRCYRH